MDNKRRIIIKIYGNEYTLITDKEEEYIKNIAQKVDDIMNEIGKSNPKYSQTMVAVLTSLNLADALYKTQEELHITNVKFEDLHAETQRPLKEINDLRNELEALREQYSKIQSEYTRTQIEFGKLNRDWIKAQEELRDIKCELAVSKDTINELQSKLFENQIELLKTKKELDQTNKIQRTNLGKSNRV